MGDSWTKESVVAYNSAQGSRACQTKAAMVWLGMFHATDKQRVDFLYLARKTHLAKGVALW